jgi:acetyl esterase/lipase
MKSAAPTRASSTRTAWLIADGVTPRSVRSEVAVARRPPMVSVAGVAADLKVFDGMSHNWQLYAPMLDEGMASIEECAAFIKAHQA